MSESGFSYESMLEDAYSRLPAKPKSTGRFEVPRPKVEVAGKRTIILNFKQIAEAMNRGEGELANYLVRELGTAPSFEGDNLILQGRFNQQSIERAINVYIRDYVICPVCRRPDTVLVKEKRFLFLVCQACGARSSVRPY
ncbi:MAG: translation initiation factor IF-2 subunit beta [Nitrososphaerota archaeon]|nr:translation initiation factor IF-2 subunit beta [Candidatus Bathyarchaeota archaeon]MCX8162751.1 translation initiation factor IF-2 subunit beta [Candidatus Bathyarchaeota archaeon]MDW8061629.1 translation initiation factor IF-2 subunit beta [Nitrososphaerota archaeon]